MNSAEKDKRFRDNALDNKAASNCELHLDRVGGSAGPVERKSIRNLPGYRCVRSHFLRSGVYQRILQLENLKTGANFFFYDLPRVPWVPKTRFILIANDRTGLQPTELLAIFELIPDARLFLLEIAFDFNKKAGMTLAFVLAHALFGKSRFLARKPGILWFGSRRSAKFVRAYWKRQIGALRIELELHGPWLRRHKIDDLFHFNFLPSLIAPRHIYFCRVDWAKVSKRVRRSHPNHGLACRNLSWQRSNLHATLSFLRHELGWPNARRFLIPLATNRIVATALKEWAETWPAHPFQLTVRRKLRLRAESRTGVRHE